MKIKQGIRRCYSGKTRIVVTSSSNIYVADLRNRSSNVRGIEISDAPIRLSDGGETVDCVHFDNQDILSIDFAIFDDHQFKRPDGTDDRHCEGCMYPTYTDPSSWVAFLEIKDCKVKNYSSYKKYAKRQIYNAVKAFRDRGILSCEKIYGIISIPRKHLEFNDTLFVDSIEVMRLRRFTGIRFYGTNNVFIINDLRIRPEM